MCDILRVVTRLWFDHKQKKINSHEEEIKKIIFFAQFFCYFETGTTKLPTLKRFICCKKFWCGLIFDWFLDTQVLEFRFWPLREIILFLAIWSSALFAHKSQMIKLQRKKFLRFFSKILSALLQISFPSSKPIEKGLRQ